MASMVGLDEHNVASKWILLVVDTWQLRVLLIVLPHPASWRGPTDHQECEDQMQAVDDRQQRLAASSTGRTVTMNDMQNSMQNGNVK